MRRVGRIAVILATVAAGARPALAAEPPEKLAPCLACHGPKGQSQIENVPSLGGQPLICFQLPGPNAIAPQKELELLVAANGPMEKVSGVGDTAQMFIGGGENGFTARVLMLYVAKGNAFLTIGVGGFTDEAVALEKAKTVAQKIFEHL